MSQQRENTKLLAFDPGYIRRLVLGWASGGGVNEELAVLDADRSLI